MAEVKSLLSVYQYSVIERRKRGLTERFVIGVGMAAVIAVVIVLSG